MVSVFLESATGFQQMEENEVIQVSLVVSGLIS